MHQINSCSSFVLETCHILKIFEVCLMLIEQENERVIHTGGNIKWKGTEKHGNPICEPCLNRNPFLNQLRVRSGRWGKLDRKAWQFLLLRYFYFCYEVLFLNCSPTTCHSLFRMIVHNSLLILYISKNSHLV